MMNRIGLAVVICILGLGLGGMVGLSSGGGGDNLQVQCMTQVQNLGNCLTFVTDKGDKPPSKECCNSVSSMKSSKPVCLCFIIEEVNNGSNPQIKSLGVQLPKLLQLPKACQLDANVTNCPKLLGISPTSPGAAIFMNSSSAATPGGSSSTPTTSSPDTSAGLRHSINGVLFVTLLSTLIPVTTLRIPFHN